MATRSGRTLAAVEPLFEFDRVSLRVGSTEVLREVDLRVPADGVTVVLGGSGAGKSTLLRCCNRLEVPTSGTVRYRGEDVESLEPRAHRREVAMVFQTPTAFPGSVLDNLHAAEQTLDRTGARALLDRVGLPDALLDRSADALSGGEAQRMVVARALATRPRVLLADEPTSALDGTSTRRLEALATGLARDGLPVVWVTHDLDQMRRIADHLIVLCRGEVTYAGPPRGDGATAAIVSSWGPEHDHADPAPGTDAPETDPPDTRHDTAEDT